MKMVSVLALTALFAASPSALKLNGRELPKDFKYGCGVSAYQVEGAWNADRKSASIWDRFAQMPGKTEKGQNGNVAMDFYHSYAKDIPLFFSATGIKTFDTTLAWTRILPQGTGKTANKAGIDYYRRVAQATHKAGGTFTATLYHWDLPEALQQRYKGWVSPKIVDDFGNYARVAMTALGDVVDEWISLNEPRTFCTEGYGPEPVSAPGYNGTLIDQYRCFHHALLAHARAAEVFADLKKQGKVKGKFSIKIDGAPAKPFDPKSKKDQEAATRIMDMQETGWALGPLTTGDYSHSLREAFGKDLPQFTKQESESLMRSYDSVYYDVYTSVYAKHIDGCKRGDDTWPFCVEETSDKNGKPIGKPTGSDWNFLVDDTLYSGLHYMHDRWGLKKPLIVGETGLAVKGGDKQSLAQKLNDKDRVEWYRTYFAQMDRIFKEGNTVNLQGFTFWSCISNFEWHSGYGPDFGVIYAPPGANKPRHVKNSAHYLKDVLVHGLSSASTKWG